MNFLSTLLAASAAAPAAGANAPAPELLAQLRDIHAAPAVPWWPPAPGWWLLAALLLAALAWLAVRAIKRLRIRLRRKRLAQTFAQRLQGLDAGLAPGAWLAEANRMLKAAAMRTAFAPDCASLEGTQWVRFLAAGDPARESALLPLAAGPYQPAPRFDAAALEAGARDWILRHG